MIQKYTFERKQLFYELISKMMLRLSSCRSVSKVPLILAYERLRFKTKKDAFSILFEIGGGKGDRTPDLLHAMQALSQLSYTPDSKSFLLYKIIKVKSFL